MPAPRNSSGKSRRAGVEGGESAPPKIGAHVCVRVRAQGESGVDVIYAEVGEELR